MTDDAKRALKIVFWVGIVFPTLFSFLVFGTVEIASRFPMYP
jgi:hypothetical protein